MIARSEEWARFVTRDTLKMGIEFNSVRLVMIGEPEHKVSCKCTFSVVISVQAVVKIKIFDCSQEMYYKY